MKFSLRSKIFMLISLMMMTMCIVCIMANRVFIRDIIGDHYSEDSRAIANTVAEVIDAGKVMVLRDRVLSIYTSTDNKVKSDQWGSPEFDAYISLYKEIEELPEYTYLREWMRMFQENSEIDCIYLIWFDEGNKDMVYLCDAALTDICPPGCIDDVSDISDMTLKNPDPGLLLYETNSDKYGWLVTSASPIYFDGNPIAYVAADVRMQDVIDAQNHYSLLNALIYLLVTAILGVIGMLVVDHHVVKPINQLSEVASTYKHIKPELGALEHTGFSLLDIKTGDEIEVLAESMKKMESDLNDQIETLFSTRQELISTREQADIMHEMANRDALTGIRNKRGYDTEIQHINKQIVSGRTGFGVVMVDMNGLKQINDSYGHEKGDKVICSLCDILCSIFKRSPVFRIGGDEFVVVVENQDFSNLDKNVEKFKASIRHSINDMELEPWERTDAAIGYAVYDPELDCGIEDTLRRADEQMYVDKRSMKS